MEHKLSTKFCQYLVHNRIITNEYYDVYVYGMELLLSFIFSTILIILIGVLTDNLIPTIEYLIIFIILRNFTGGYHASTYLRCKIASIFIYTTTICVTIHVPVDMKGYLALGIMGYIIIYYFAPIENPNKPLSFHERKKHKITSLILFTVFIGTSFIMNLSNVESNIIFYTLLSVIILMIISPHRKKGGFGREEDL